MVKFNVWITIDGWRGVWTEFGFVGRKWMWTAEWSLLRIVVELIGMNVGIEFGGPSGWEATGRWGRGER